MAEPKITLTAADPITSDLPVTQGAMTLARVDPGPLTLIAPFKGQSGAVSDALHKAIGLGLPDTGKLVQENSVTLQWFGRGQFLLSGAPMPNLEGAAVTDQTDGWVTHDLTGPDVAQVMARLVPVDLRDATARVGTAIRTDLHGMMVAVARTSPEVLRIMGFRSMAKSLTHAISDAMSHAAALS